MGGSTREGVHAILGGMAMLVFWWVGWETKTWESLESARGEKGGGRDPLEDDTQHFMVHEYRRERAGLSRDGCTILYETVPSPLTVE